MDSTANHTVTDATREAVRVLLIHTGGRVDLWSMAGNHKAGGRAHVMSVLRGVQTPQSKAGVTALRTALYDACGITGGCEAHREDNFRAFVRALVSKAS